MNSNYLKNLRIIYFSLAIGIVFFMLVSFLIHSIKGSLAEKDVSPTQQVSLLVMLVLLTGITFMSYRAIVLKKLETIKTLPTLERKLAAWRELCVLQGVLIEAPAFFAVFLFILLGVYALLVWPVVSILIFWVSQPSRDRLIREVSLSSREMDEFEKLD